MPTWNDGFMYRALFLRFFFVSFNVFMSVFIYCFLRIFISSLKNGPSYFLSNVFKIYSFSFKRLSFF